MNMISPSDLFEAEEIERVKEELAEECLLFGDILSIEIPKPVAVKDEHGNETN
jgi:hypothetical protein